MEDNLKTNGTRYPIVVSDEFSIWASKTVSKGINKTTVVAGISCIR